MRTELAGRTLRFDGVSVIEPGELARFLLLGVPPSKLRVTEETEDVRTLNEQASDEDRVPVDGDEPIIDLSWQLPPEYANLNINTYFANLFFDEQKQAELAYSPTVFDAAVDRIGAELMEIEKRGMTEFFRTVVYILDKLREHKVVWGVGRGSSCASYLLFLAGLHVVDCVTMEVPLDEFFHD